MGSLTIEAALFSVQQKAPNFKFGWINPIPLAPSGTTGAEALVRVSTARIPKGAVITSASFTVVSFKTEATHTLAIQKLTAGATWNSNTTWSTKPGLDAGSKITLARTNPAAGTGWIFAGIASWVQAAASAGKPLDFAVTAETAGTWYIHGPAGTTQRRAWVTLEYTAPAETPTALNPAAGVIGVAKPVLTFDADPDTTAVQVQIDPAMNGTTPAFQSAETASDTGYLDLAATAYTGLANTATTYWRARNQNPLGWSEWSGWQQITRTDKPPATIVSPTTTPDDLTPELAWTFTPQTAWSAFLHDANGKTLALSGRTAGNVHDWDPGVELDDGQQAKFILRLWDDKDRDASPGDPEYVEVQFPFTVTLTEGTAAVTSATATMANDFEPRVLITGTRAAGIPDYLLLYRENPATGAYQFLKRVDGTAAFSGGTYTLVDEAPPVNAALRYRVRAEVGGVASAPVTTAFITPTCQGTWLYRPGTSEKVVLWSGAEQEQDQPEIDIVHAPLPRDDGSQPEVIRRRLARALDQGTLTGLLFDDPACPVTALAAEATLRTWADLDAGTTYRILLGRRSMKVILGRIRFEETTIDKPGSRVLRVSMAYWEREG